MKSEIVVMNVKYFQFGQVHKARPNPHGSFLKGQKVHRAKHPQKSHRLRLTHG